MTPHNVLYIWLWKHRVLVLQTPNKIGEQVETDYSPLARESLRSPMCPCTQPYGELVTTIWKKGESNEKHWLRTTGNPFEIQTGDVTEWVKHLRKVTAVFQQLKRFTLVRPDVQGGGRAPLDSI